MARVVGLNRESSSRSSTGLARIEDVRYEELKKKYMEEMGDEIIPRDERSVDEIQADEDSRTTSEFMEFWEMDDDIDLNQDDPLETLSQISSMMEEEAKDEFESAEQQREQYINDDAADKIEQIAAFSINEDDPFLSEDYKAKSERIIKKIELAEEEGTRGSPLSSYDYDEPAKESKRSNNYNRSGYSYDEPSRSTSTSGFRSAASTSTTTSTVIDHEERDKRVAMQYAESAEKVRGFVANGPRKQRKEKQKTVYQFGAKRRFSWKGIKNSVKRWLRSDDAMLVFKVGMMISIETALAVITKKYSFDGAGQALGFLGMNLGLFFVATEINGLGYDPRRLALI